MPQDRWNGQLVFQLRVHLNMGQKEFGEMLGTYQHVISDWEQGLWQPSGIASKLLDMIAAQTAFNPDKTITEMALLEGRE